MTIVTETPPAGINQGRADFIKPKFDALIWEKGYDVILEKALRCPCVSRNTNQQSNCKNCGGTSWIFVNPTETRMVISAMNIDTKFKEWSETNVGNANISSLSQDELSFMDRITVRDGNAIFGEALFLKQVDTTGGKVYYWTTVYNIKEISYLALFIDVNTILKPLTYGTDFTYEDNKIIFLTALDYITDPSLEEQDFSITVRYKHAPQLHIIDVRRETIQTFVNIALEGEQKVDLPVNSVARRSHYVLNRQNFDGTRILNNDHIFAYTDLNPPVEEC